ncbi:hypothetical protein SH668x_001167 [Planctomicrobium sp. SH668]|uniref:hypothetical protein n=1 Tax=Planctomicrobium sp. SH668 TaxID=3448126 RepID=UPI003F5C040D
MPSSHRIRLQGPWQIHPPGASPEVPPLTLTLPQAWSAIFGETAGTAVFRRKFNTPTNLTSEQQVFICIPPHAGRIEFCQLNGIRLTANSPLENRFNATTAIGGFNSLEIAIECDPAECPPEAGGIWQPVTLEIVEP